MSSEREPEVTTLDFRHGHLCLASYERITFETITRMAAAAELIGIPPNAVVNRIGIRADFGPIPRATEIDIDWAMPER